MNHVAEDRNELETYISIINDSRRRFVNIGDKWIHTSYQGSTIFVVTNTIFRLNCSKNDVVSKNEREKKLQKKKNTRSFTRTE